MYKMQIKVMLHKKAFRIAFWISMIFAIAAFGYEKRLPHGIYNALYYYCGFGDTPHWSWYSALLCFLVAVPFATSFQDDLSDRTLGTILVRSSKKTYLKAKMAATFLGNFLMVVIPFLTNLVLCLIFLPHCSETPYGTESGYIAMLEGTRHGFATPSPAFPLVWLVKFNPLLYCILFLLVLGCFVGILGVALLAFSFWCRKYKIVLFLPVFLLMKIGSVLTERSYNQAIGNYDHMLINWELWDYVAPFSFSGKFYPIFWGFILILCGFIYISYRHICGKEYMDV